MRIFFASARSRFAFVFVGGLLTLVSFVALAQLGGTAGVLIPYSGHLELDGEPVDSLTPVNFRFTLWDAAAGGSACGSKYSAAGVVRGGRFSVEIGPVNESCVLGKPVFLAVEVEGAAGYTQLAGRQRVYPAVGALTSGVGDFFVNGTLDVAGDSYADRLRLSATNDLGLGTTNSGLTIGPASGANLAMDTNEIMTRNNGAPTSLYLNFDGGDLHLGNSESSVAMPGAVEVGALAADALTVSGAAKGFARGGGDRRCSSNSAVLRACSAWGTGACDNAAGCGGAAKCDKGVLKWSSGLTACFDGGYGDYSAGCQSWVCLE